MMVVSTLLVVTLHTVSAQAITIDTAISTAAREISENVPEGAIIAVLNMSSDYARLSNYVIDELIAHLVSTGLFQVVSRRAVELEVVRRELYFQYTGYVSDESQRSLGRFLGADTIISGSITTDSANSYRLMVNAIDLESLVYILSYRASFRNDKQVTDGAPSTWVAFGLNFFPGFGVGSFVQGDTTGGGIALIGDALGWGLLITGLVIRANNYDDWGPGDRHNLGTGLAVVGSIGLVGTKIFQLIRPFAYTNRVQIAFSPAINNSGNLAVTAALRFKLD